MAFVILLNRDVCVLKRAARECYSYKLVKLPSERLFISSAHHLQHNGKSTASRRFSSLLLHWVFNNSFTACPSRLSGLKVATKLVTGDFSSFRIFPFGIVHDSWIKSCYIYYLHYWHRDISLRPFQVHVTDIPLLFLRRDDSGFIDWLGPWSLQILLQLCVYFGNGS